MHMHMCLCMRLSICMHVRSMYENACASACARVCMLHTHIRTCACAYVEMRVYNV